MGRWVTPWRCLRRERIEGIRQIEVAWSRVPGAESTGLHTEHTPSRGPSLTLFHPSLLLALSFPSLSLSLAASLPYARRSPPSLLVLSLSLSPSSLLGGILVSSSSSSARSSSRFLSCRFPFRSLSRCYSEWRRSSRDNHRRCLPSSSLSSAAASLDRHPFLPSWLALSVNHPPRRSFPASPPPSPRRRGGHPPPPADVSASRVASESHPMANATSKSRRGQKWRE